jgi:hypothetical protein
MLILGHVELFWLVSQIIMKHGYSSEQAFTVDETRLFWKNRHSNFFIMKEDTGMPSDDGLTFSGRKCNCRFKPETDIGLTFCDPISFGTI